MYECLFVQTNRRGENEKEQQEDEEDSEEDLGSGDD
jgi:hypothetical protein